MSNPAEWSIDPSQSTVTFKVDPLIFSAVKGSFKLFDAEIQTTGGNFNSVKVSLRIDAASVNTGDQERDDDLRSDAFFDVANHPEITFVSDKVKVSVEAGHYEMWGNLTMKGITQEVRIDIQSAEVIDNDSAPEKAQFTVTGKLNRKHWGVISYGSDKVEGPMESEEVNILCNVTLVRRL